MRLTLEETNAMRWLAQCRAGEEFDRRWEVISGALVRAYGTDYEAPKPLTSEDQDQLEYIRTYRTRSPGSTTQFEMAWLIELIDRLPREPRKQTLGQVLFYRLMKGTSCVWERASEDVRNTYEQHARTVIDEYVLRTRGKP